MRPSPPPDAKRLARGFGLHPRARRWCRIGIIVLYALAGVLHLAMPQLFMTITPNWVPDAPLVIALTGICELAGAAGLSIPRLRRYAGIGLALFAVCVFPANVKHAIDTLSGAHPSTLQWTYHVVRLPLQPAFVWLALFAGDLPIWPLHRGETATEQQRHRAPI